MRVMENNKWKKRIIYGLFIIAGILVLGTIAGLILVKTLPSPNNFNIQKVNQSTKIFDKTGNVLLYEIHGEEKRTVVPFSEIPETVKKATLAAEDSDFYNQPAFDWKSMVRAVFVNLREGRIAQGGSTITQQLAKNIFLSPEKTILRKVKELVLAVQLEARYSKDEIFYFYLNQIPYGSNAYGVEAASQTFFGKDAKNLTLEESALLASLPKAPSYYSPYGQHVSELLARKNYILDQMARLHYISEDQSIEAKKKTITFLPQSIGSIRAPHFSLMVKEYLEEKYGEKALNENGYKVITTLDWKLQEIAEKVVSEAAQNNEKLYQGKNAALVAEDPKTGQILAFVGSRDYFNKDIQGNFNVPTQGLRQPGSALKPFVYLTAFEKGYSPETILFDVKTEFDTRGGSESYSPDNFDNTFHGPVHMKEALAWSLNVPAVKTLYLVGIDSVLNTLHNVGITTLNDKNRYGLTLVLGGGEIKLFDLVNAYATLAADGKKHTQSIILKIEDNDGSVLEETKNDEGEQVVEPQYPRLITKILTDEGLRAGLLQASLPSTIFSGYRVALKTGTTQDYRDAWAFGYTPFLTVGVWAGNTNNLAMGRQGGSLVAAIPMWSKFWAEALKNYQPENFPEPDTLTLPNKPMLNGEYIWSNNGNPEAHSILFYVDKNNPVSTWPQNPASDPQFSNWEAAVASWARGNNLQNNFTAPPVNKTENASLGQNEIQIINVTPNNGDIRTGPFVIHATILSGSELRRIELYQNGFLKNAINVSGKKFDYQYYFSDTLAKKNDFELRVINENQKSQSTFFSTIQ